MNMVINAYGKVNLTLAVEGRRDDGYHNLSGVMQTISLYNTVTLNLIAEGIKITCDTDGVPLDERNTAYRAAKLYMDEVGYTGGVHIDIEKGIPHLAGLGSASADAAAVLTGLDSMLDIGMDSEKLRAIGLKVGADVPFCMLTQGTALVEGIGDIITPLTALPNCHIVVVKPNFDLSTPDVFKHYDSLTTPQNPPVKQFVEAVNGRDLQQIASLMGNALEQSVEQTHPGEIEALKAELKSMGALGAVMSGTGSSVIGIFDVGHTAKAVAEHFKAKGLFSALATPVDDPLSDNQHYPY